MLEAIYPIVEGHGEQHAVPLLLRRFAREVFGNHAVQILPPHRIARGKLVKTGATDLERAAELGRRKLLTSYRQVAMLLLLDADEDCPAELGPALLRRLMAAAGGVPIAVVLAKRELEAWFLAAAHSLRRHKRGSDEAASPADPESVPHAKAYLQERLLIPGARCSEVVDQPAFTAVFDLHEARQVPSFDKLWRDLGRLFGQSED